MAVKKMSYEDGLEQERVYQLKMQGQSPAQIAKHMGISVARVRRRLEQREISWVAAETVQQVRELENARLEHYLLQLHPRIIKGDMAAIALAVKISESRRKLVGADAPVQVQASVEHTVAPEIAAKVAEAQRANAEREREIRERRAARKAIAASPQPEPTVIDSDPVTVTTDPPAPASTGTPSPSLGHAVQPLDPDDPLATLGDLSLRSIEELADQVPRDLLVDVYKSPPANFDPDNEDEIKALFIDLIQQGYAREREAS